MNGVEEESEGRRWQTKIKGTRLFRPRTLCYSDSIPTGSAGANWGQGGVGVGVNGIFQLLFIP